MIDDISRGVRRQSTSTRLSARSVVDVPPDAIVMGQAAGGGTFGTNLSATPDYFDFSLASSVIEGDLMILIVNAEATTPIGITVTGGWTKLDQQELHDVPGRGSNFSVYWRIADAADDARTSTHRIYYTMPQEEKRDISYSAVYVRGYDFDGVNFNRHALTLGTMKRQFGNTPYEEREWDVGSFNEGWFAVAIGFADASSTLAETAWHEDENKASVEILNDTILASYSYDTSSHYSDNDFVAIPRPTVAQLNHGGGSPIFVTNGINLGRGGDSIGVWVGLFPIIKGEVL